MACFELGSRMKLNIPEPTLSSDVKLSGIDVVSPTTIKPAEVVEFGGRKSKQLDCFPSSKTSCPIVRPELKSNLNHQH